jgi:RsiW-degrading membrane proteinase PrsW (M82 family)
VLDIQPTNLLSPETAPEEVYPYRRVWRSLAIEIVVMLGMVVLILVGVLLGVLVDVRSRNWGLLLILVPLAAYLWFSVRGEQRAPRPREGLLTVTLFSALLANGVGVPLVEGVFVPRLWLSEGGFFSRVLGYSFTVGVTIEFLKYIAIRYTVWPRRFRVRMDGIAYGIAAGVGYSVVLNGRVVFFEEATVTAEALRIATNFIVQSGFSAIMGYFLASLALQPSRSPFYLAGGLFVASLMQGLYIAFRRIAIGSGDLNGLFLALFFVLLVALVINFLIENADSREANLKGIRRIR